ncbi:TIGR00341 family protein [Desulfosediminicola sp.]|uniref:TIGR00341 family protein n=1 Tax=Desulfosediminicola sp. TaxID=2886825 RepID=UPI003AF2E619
MGNRVDSDLFVYSEAGKGYHDRLARNSSGTVVTSLPMDTFSKNPEAYLRSTQHIVVAAELSSIKQVIEIAVEHGASLGILPLDDQKALVQCYGLPKNTQDRIDIALKSEHDQIDIVRCNNHILLFKGVFGRLPLFDSHMDSSKIQVVWDALKRVFSLQLHPITISTADKRKTQITTAASGCVILEEAESGLLPKSISDDCSNRDGMISLVLVAPFSVIDYLRLIWAQLVSGPNSSLMPNSIGLVKSSQIAVDSEDPLTVSIDGEGVTTTPVYLSIARQALKINHGLPKKSTQDGESRCQEKVLTASLPTGKELNRAGGKRLPFFTYASEQRFKDLFTALRDDALLDSKYILLMVLSTIIATVGLFLNSASVIIGAMLLAPLMAPIIAMAMGLLRNDRSMYRQSFKKIMVGIILALATSATITVISPYQPFTLEMQGRLNPTVLDLVVAIVAGIAGAYTKSFKEILQSLAGVAIAVALVPPLAVAGIGLGRFDISFFSQAFLLFSTNLIGIVLAATFTFRVLGFSPAVRDKRRLSVVSLFLLAIFIPLFLSFQGIVERARFEKSWQYERFLVNGKYLIVDTAELHTFHRVKVLTVDLQVREQLNRSDLNEFKRKVKRNFSDNLVIRAKVTYIP